MYHFKYCSPIIFVAFYSSEKPLHFHQLALSYIMCIF